ncbi:hypothetical protein GCM10020218_018490 [Dactylosporangium vinaceum]
MRQLGHPGFVAHVTPIQHLPGYQLWNVDSPHFTGAHGHSLHGHRIDATEPAAVEAAKAELALAARYEDDRTTTGSPVGDFRGQRHHRVVADQAVAGRTARRSRPRRRRRPGPR